MMLKLGWYQVPGLLFTNHFLEDLWLLFSPLYFSWLFKIYCYFFVWSIVHKKYEKNETLMIFLVVYLIIINAQGGG